MNPVHHAGREAHWVVGGRLATRRCWILGLLFWTAFSSFAATNSADSYLVKNWTTADGIPHNTVRSIIESRDGYLWMGTANGLARFDGVRFVSFDQVNTPDLIADDIFELYEDRRGSIWMTTRRGLARHHGGRFELLSSTNAGPFALRGAFAEDTDGTLWLRGPNGLARWTGDQFEPVRLPPDGPSGFVHMCAAPDGGLWLAASNGLWRFRNGRAERTEASPAPVLVAAGRDGQLWGLVGNRRLFALRNGEWSQVADFSREYCTSLSVAPNGDVWVGSDTRNLALRWRDGQLTEINGQHGLEGNRVLAFWHDREGNVWLGLNAGGLFRLRERRVRLLDRRDGFEGLNTASIGQLTNGTMMVNVMGSTLHQFGGERFAPVRVRGGPEAYGLPTAIMPARNGGVWAGTFYGSLLRIKDGLVVENVGSASGTRSLFTDRDGQLWRGTRTAGIESFAGTNLTRFTTNEGLSFNNVYCFAQDRDGAVWAGTEQGLNRIEGGQITRFGPTNGLGHQFISSLCVDSRGTLWAGTLGGGLSGWNGTRFITISTREGLVHDSVDQVIEDDLGQLWLGTRAGLLRLSVAQLHDFLAGQVRVVTGTLIGRDEGLARANFWTEYQPACLKARDGQLWFCTGSGVVVIDPQRFKTAAAAPVVHIEEVKVDGAVQAERQPARPAITVPPGKERVEIRYTGISPAEPAQVRFRYQLAGYDRDWVEAGRARFANYSHVPPGPYEFRVKAVNNDGVWNEVGATLALVVQPTFWQTRGFRVLMALIFLGLLYVAYRLRVGQLEIRRAAQESFSRKLIASQEQERKRIAAELHDSLGQNLLVIKNRVALALTQQDQAEKMAAQMQEVSTMASAAIREVREIAQNLRPFQIDELGLTKSIMAMARTLGDASDVHFTTDLDDMDGALPPEFEINFYRIVQECLNNVVKHSQAREASIQLRRSPRVVRLTVTDNGSGFDARPGGGDHAAGFGLKNIVERARTMDGEVEIHSRLGEGTQVEIQVPLR